MLRAHPELAGTPAGVQRIFTEIRWCRSFLAQPPATSCDPAGIDDTASACRRHDGPRVIKLRALPDDVFVETALSLGPSSGKARCYEEAVSLHLGHAGASGVFALMKFHVYRSLGPPWLGTPLSREPAAGAVVRSQRGRPSRIHEPAQTGPLPLPRIVGRRCSLSCETFWPVLSYRFGQPITNN